MAAPLASAALPSAGPPEAVRLLHTSDLQIDAPFGFLGERGAAHRRQLRQTFRRITELVRAGSYHLLLIAGDLFDDNRPSQASLELVRDLLAGLPVPVCILPGNHDCYDRSSVYRRETFSPNVHVLTETPSLVDFPDLDLTVTANAVLSRESHDSPLRAIGQSGGRRWHVVMAHGNVCRPGQIEAPSRPITPEEIAACGADYLALGDWHGFADNSQTGVAAFYSGAPEPTRPNASGSGFAASVTLSGQGVEVRPVRVGHTETEQLFVDIGGRSQSEIIGLIRQRVRESLMLDVVLRGLRAPDQLLDAQHIAVEAGEGFYWLRVSDQSHLELSAIDLGDYPETQVIGQYVRLLADRIQHAATSRDRQRAERAMQLGVALLRGKEALL